MQRCHDGRGRGGYVQRMEVIVKRKKVRGGGQGGCELRSEALVKIKKKSGGGGGVRLGGRVGFGGGGGGNRVDVNGEVKLL